MNITPKLKPHPKPLSGGEGPAWTDKAASRIAGAFITLQTRFAEFMNKKFTDMSKSKMKIIIIVFGLIGGGSSLYLIARAVFAKPETAIKIDRVDAPKHFDKTGEDTNELMVDEETYRQIQAFKKSTIYDSTIKARAGLQDSIKLLEHIYQSQKLK